MSEAYKPSPNGAERFSVSKPASPEVSDMEPVVAAVLRGDEEAYASLDQWMDRNLRGSFRSMGADADDLMQDAKIKAYAALATFDPQLGNKNGSYTGNLKNWVITIGRNVRIDEHRRRKNHGALPLSPEAEEYLRAPEDDGNEETQRPQIDWQAVLKDKIDELVTAPMQREVVRLTLEGRNADEISAIIGCSKASVKVRLHKARKVLEEKIIYPAGFKRLSCFIDGRSWIQTELGIAARVGRLEAVKFLNLYYATPEAVKRYRAGKKTVSVSQELINEGYLLLADAIESYTEYEYIKDHTTSVLRSGGRVYIKPEDLEAERHRYKTPANRPRPRILAVIPEGYMPLPQNLDSKAYHAVRYAIQHQEMPFIKVGERILVERHVLEDFLKAREERKARTTTLASNP